MWLVAVFPNELGDNFRWRDLGAAGLPFYVMMLYALATFIPTCAVTVRRLHDCNYSGWWLLVGLVLYVGEVALFALLCFQGTAGDNRFGAAPPGWDGRAQMGRSDIRLRPHAVEEGEPRRWGEFYAEDRILPYLQPSRDNGSISAAGAGVVERLCERLRDGDFDTDQPALVRAGARTRLAGPGETPRMRMASLMKAQSSRTAGA